ncbi:unnamed protein product, partial [Polarella glacialis]
DHGTSASAVPSNLSSMAQREEIMALRCNFPLRDGAFGRVTACGCRVDGGIAWATDCSHILCDAHAEGWFGTAVVAGKAPADRPCPVCSGNNIAKLLRLDLARPTRERRLAIIGLPPREALAAAGDALRFWADQKALQAAWRAKAQQSAREASQERSRAANVALRAEEELGARRRQLQQELHRALAHKNSLQSEVQRLRGGQGQHSNNSANNNNNHSRQFPQTPHVQLLQLHAVQQQQQPQQLQQQQLPLAVQQQAVQQQQQQLLQQQQQQLLPLALPDTRQLQIARETPTEVLATQLNSCSQMPAFT